MLSNTQSNFWLIHWDTSSKFQSLEPQFSLKLLGNLSYFFVLDDVHNVVTTSKNKFLELLTWLGRLRPGNKTKKVFDEESKFSGGVQTKFLRKNIPYQIWKKYFLICFCSLLVSFKSLQGVILGLAVLALLLRVKDLQTWILHESLIYRWSPKTWNWRSS